MANNATSSGSLAHWLEKRSSQWQHIHDRLQQQSGRRDLDVREAMSLVVQYRNLVRDLSLAKHVLPNSQLALLLQSLLLKAHEAIYRKPFFLKQQLSDLFRMEIPQVVYDIRGVIIATFVLFIVSALCGWLLVFNYPPLASLFASEAMINTVQGGALWTDDLLNIMPSSMLSASIMTNNIVVAITAFVLGAFYGLGTIYIISLNGIMLGGIFAFTHEYGMADELFTFVVAHGVVELSVICLAGAAGVSLGEALMRPGNQSRGKAFQEAVQKGGKLLLMCVVFLIGAGIIEGYVSPDGSYPLSSRLIIGFGYGLLLYAVMTGRLWRRNPGKVTPP
ncbi:stage II sporulation protein M [Kaarinaea lacus]